MSINYIAYQGEKFTIEWYYHNKKSLALNFYEKLSLKDKAKVFYLFKRMADAGEIYDRTKFNYEGDQIYTFKPQPNRFLCFFHEGRKIIVTNAYHKKTRMLPPEEKEKALKYKKDYLIRIKQGDYYE